MRRSHRKRRYVHPDVCVGDTPPAKRNDDVMTRWNPIFIVFLLNCRDSVPGTEWLLPIFGTRRSSFLLFQTLRKNEETIVCGLFNIMTFKTQCVFSVLLLGRQYILRLENNCNWSTTLWLYFVFPKRAVFSLHFLIRAKFISDPYRSHDARTWHIYLPISQCICFSIFFNFISLRAP